MSPLLGPHPAVRGLCEEVGHACEVMSCGTCLVLGWNSDLCRTKHSACAGHVHGFNIARETKCCVQRRGLNYMRKNRVAICRAAPLHAKALAEQDKKFQACAAAASE